MPPKKKGSKKKAASTKGGDKEEKEDVVQFATPALMKYYRDTLDNEEKFSKINEAEINVKYLASQRKLKQEKLRKSIKEEMEELKALKVLHEGNLEYIMKASGEIGEKFKETAEEASQYHIQYEKRYLTELEQLCVDFETSLDAAIQQFLSIKKDIGTKYQHLIETEKRSFEVMEQRLVEKLSEITQMHSGNKDDSKEEIAEEISCMKARTNSYVEELERIKAEIREKFCVGQDLEEAYTSLIADRNAMEKKCKSLSSTIEKLQAQLTQKKEFFCVNREEWNATNDAVRREKQAVDAHFSSLSKEYKKFVKSMSSITAELSETTQETYEKLEKTRARGGKIVNIIKAIEKMEPDFCKLGISRNLDWGIEAPEISNDNAKYEDYIRDITTANEILKKEINTKKVFEVKLTELVVNK